MTKSKFKIDWQKVWKEFAEWQRGRRISNSTFAKEYKDSKLLCEKLEWLVKKYTKETKL